MTAVAIAELVVICALAAALVWQGRRSLDTLAAREESHREERFEMQERIRVPEARPPRARRRASGDGAGAENPNDLKELARVGTVVAPLDDNEGGVAS